MSVVMLFDKKNYFRHFPEVLGTEKLFVLDRNSRNRFRLHLLKFRNEFKPKLKNTTILSR